MSSSSNSRIMRFKLIARRRPKMSEGDCSDDEPLVSMRKRNYSASPTRTFKSPKPKISVTRLSPIASSDDVGASNQGTKTKFTLTDLNRMADLYPWPEGVTLCLPDEKSGSLAKYPDSVVVHEESLKAGFRLPVPTFICDFLNFTELCPAQISPNSWRYIAAFGIRCWELNKEANFVGMQYWFEMREASDVFSFYMHNPNIMAKINSSIKNWKDRWFLVKIGDGENFNFRIHPGTGVKFKKGKDEIKEISGEEMELRDAFLSLESTDLHYSQLITHANLENAGLSLPHPRHSTKPGLSLIKSAIKKQNCLNSTATVGASKKRARGSSSYPRKEEERPTKKRLVSVLLEDAETAEHVEATPPQPKAKSPVHQFRIAADSRCSPDRKPNYLASSLTFEEANGLLKGATVSADAVSALKGIPDDQASAEFARAVALQVYHANNLIEKHEKLVSSHSGSRVKLERLEEENKELQLKLSSAKLYEDTMKEKIQSLEGDLKKAREENADSLKKTREENAEMRKKIMELKTELSMAKDMGKEELLSSKLNEESLKKQLKSTNEDLKRTKEKNDKLRQRIMELKSEMSKTTDREEVIDSKPNGKDLKMQIQSLKEDLKRFKEETADNLNKIQKENAESLMKIQEDKAELCQKITELETDLSRERRVSKWSEESAKRQIQRLKENLTKMNDKNADTLQENGELRQQIVELKTGMEKAKDTGKEEFLESKAFYRRVAHFNATYYMSGLRVGVCQAVNRYGHLDPEILEFEPDFDDDCGYDVPDPPPYSSPIRLVPM